MSFIEKEPHAFLELLRTVLYSHCSSWKEILSLENTTMSNKHFVLGGVVKVIILGFFKTTNKVVFVRFASKLTSKHTFDISIRTLNFQKKDKFGTFPVHISYGVFSTDFDGHLLSVNAHVSRACPQRGNGKYA